jgi:hypothetical protein
MDRHLSMRVTRGKSAIMKSLPKRERWILILGDALAFIAITLIDFANHEELDPRLAVRMLATWIPFCTAWFLIAPWLGLFHTPGAQGFVILWRTPLAALLTAPFGAWLRGLILHSPILPVFVLVMAGVSILTLTLWRFAIWGLYLRRPEF